jgi:hypothetical protein
MNNLDLLDIGLTILLVGWLLNFIIFIKNLLEIGYYMSPTRSNGLSQINIFKFLNMYYTRGYIPWWTIITYKPFKLGFLEYKLLFVTADSVDYIYYKTLNPYKHDKHYK